MSFSVNKVTILGNVSRDPELRYTPNGKAVATMSIATNKSIKDEREQSGYRDVASFHRVTIWGKLAEYVGKNVHSGDKCYCEGRLEYRSYDDKDGKKVYVTDVVIDTVIPMGRREKSQGQAEPTVTDKDVEDSGLMEPPADVDTSKATENVDPDDIPF